MNVCISGLSGFVETLQRHFKKANALLRSTTGSMYTVDYNKVTIKAFSGY
jgi:hypothetical protein